MVLALFSILALFNGFSIFSGFSTLSYYPHQLRELVSPICGFFFILKKYYHTKTFGEKKRKEKEKSVTGHVFCVLNHLCHLSPVTNARLLCQDISFFCLGKLAYGPKSNEYFKSLTEIRLTGDTESLGVCG